MAKKNKRLWIVWSNSSCESYYQFFVGKEPKLKKLCKVIDEWEIEGEWKKNIGGHCVPQSFVNEFLPHLKIRHGEVAELVRTKHGLTLKRGD